MLIENTKSKKTSNQGLPPETRRIVVFSSNSRDEKFALDLASTFDKVAVEKIAFSIDAKKISVEEIKEYCDKNNVAFVIVAGRIIDEVYKAVPLDIRIYHLSLTGKADLSSLKRYFHDMYQFICNDQEYMTKRYDR